MTMLDALLAGPAWAIPEAIAARRTTALAVTEAALQRLRATEGAATIYTRVLATRACQTARRLDAALASGHPLPPLAGVPLAVKNLFDIAGGPTLAGSRVLAGDPAAADDAVLVQRLEAAGAVLVGALTMDEFAYGFTTENSHVGACRNPHDPARVAGGSSGGSGAALAAGLASLTLGSDTNGSIRVPSSFCGVWGLKPTFGRLPRTGTYPFVASLDHLGPMARSVHDLALSYDAMQGPYAADPYCAGHPVQRVTPGLGRTRPLRVARLTGYFDTYANPEARAASVRVAAALGADAEIELPAAALARAAAFVVTASEGGALHRSHTLNHYDQLEPLSRDRLIAGALVPASWYLQAQRIRAWALQQVLPVFRQFDVLVAPATPGPAPQVGAETLVVNGREFPMRASVGMLTQPISSLGLPVVAAPVAMDGTLPLGVQLIAAPWREDLCFAAAAQLEVAGVCRSGVAAAYQQSREVSA